LEVEPVGAGVDVARLQASLEAAFQTRLALRVPVAVVAAGTLPRFEMKARRWVRTASDA
jgi:phenylacetate-coenzyme A ligase PaaK-like adenylate-forming protein